jgi:hypothetical protein
LSAGVQPRDPLNDEPVVELEPVEAIVVAYRDYLRTNASTLEINEVLRS